MLSGPRFAGAALLIASGSYVILSELRKDDEKQSKSERPAIAFSYLMVTGFALSIDNLVVGFALGLYRVPILLAFVVFAAVSLSMTLIGLELGGRLGSRFEQWSEQLGGAVLILVGLALAVGLF